MFRFTKVSARRKQCSRHMLWRLVIERLEDRSTMTVIDLLWATDSQSGNGLLYNGDLVKKKKANSVFGAVNQIGGI